jgi:hypothetical protein
MSYIAKGDLSICDLCITYTNGTKYTVKLKKGDELPIDVVDASDLKKSLGYGALGRLIKAGLILEVDDKKAADVSMKLRNNISPAQIETMNARDAIKAKQPVASQASQLKAKQKYEIVSIMSQKEFSDRRDNRGMIENMDMPHGKAVDVLPMSFSDVGVTEHAGGLVVTAGELRSDDVQDSAVDENGNHHNTALDDYQPTADFTKVKTFEDFDKLNHFDKLLHIRGCNDKDLLTSITIHSTVKQIVNNAKKRLTEIK